ncbi:MAG TPA: hypothetical protein VIU37_11250, partial [Candidatus Limnocylindrales bacterium]
PDSIRVELGGSTVSSRLSIDREGAVVATANGEALVLFTPNPVLPLRLSSLAVTSSGLELHGTLDVGALLR